MTTSEKGSGQSSPARLAPPKLDTAVVESAVGLTVPAEPFSALDGSTRQLENGELRLIPYPTQDPNGEH
jgi:hypothetical protein